MQSGGEQHSGVASGVNNATARVAGMLAVALLGALAVGAFRTTLDTRLARAQVPTQMRTLLREEAAKLAQAKVPAMRDELERQAVTRMLHESFVRSFRLVMGIASVIALLASLCAALTIRDGRPPSRSGAREI